MKFSIFTTLPLFAVFSTSLATAVTQPDAVATRQEPNAYVAIIQGLTAQIIEQDKLINATIAGVSPDSDPETQAAASAGVNSHIQTITALVNSAIEQVQAVPTTVAKRQDIDPAVLAALIVDLLVELSFTLNGVIAALGLSSLLGFLSPLTTGLSGLILALDVVVTGLLVLVTALVNALLIGLSVALAGVL